MPFRTIASTAEVGVATVHRHFPDRFDLVMAVANNFWDEMEGIIHRHDSEWDRDAEQTLFSNLSELAELHPLSFMAMSESVITSLEVPLDETKPIYKRALKVIGQLADNAKKHALLADDIAPCAIHRLRHHFPRSTRRHPKSCPRLHGVDDPHLPARYKTIKRTRPPQ